VVTGTEVVLAQQQSSTQRRWARHKIDVPVCIVSHAPTRVVAAQGRGSELNCGGMAVYTAVLLTIGDQVGLEFTLPTSETRLAVRGFVRNGDDGKYGIEFITEKDTDYENVARIESILKELSSIPML
jgi:PilZ domain